MIPEDVFAPSHITGSKGKSILILTADKTQDLEFFYPFYRFIEEGYQVDVVTPDGGKFEGKMGMGLKDSKSLDEVNPGQYALLYIPGGKAPEKLKKEEKALQLVEEFARSGKPIAAICHGAQLLAEAKLVAGKRIAAWPEVQKEIEEAGGSFVNEATVEDGQFITARWPGDLPSHLQRTLRVLEASAKQEGLRRAS